MIEADEALVEKSRRGDREAFEELVRRTGRMLFARLYLETGDPHHAEDLAQETFLSAWRSIHGLADAKSFRPWLFSIGHRILITSVRDGARQKRRANISGGDALAAAVDKGPEPSQTAENDDQRARVLAALRGLPQEYRIPLTLRYLAGADYQTISRDLALTNGSLRGLLARGLAMLRERM